MIEIRIKSLKNEDVKIDIEATSLSVTAQLPISPTADGGNSEYRYVIFKKQKLIMHDPLIFLNVNRVNIYGNLLSA